VWRVDEPPQKVDLRLFWFTSGKGTQDVEVIAEVGSDAASIAGEMPFSFELPLGPYSFSGSLITLSWALELVVQPGGHSERIDLVVAPTAVEVRLESLDRKPFPEEAVGFTMLSS
jgi:hypothetical protein